MDFYKCCAICGSKILHFGGRCVDCKSSRGTTKEERTKHNSPARFTPISFTSKKPIEYYKDLSIQRYNDDSRWKDIFVEQELSLNSLFDRNKYEYSCQMQMERDELVAQRDARSTEPIQYTPQPAPPLKPKCPTCSSTNIKRISSFKRGVHGLAWGLLSKTARSQFECKNCGYKW